MVRTIFVGLLVLHGLIHLLGFAKGAGLAKVPQLKTPISTAGAFLWLAAALTMFAAAVLVAAGPTRFWWVAGLGALVLSQIAVVTDWREAKLGTIPNVVVLVVVVLAMLDHRMSSLRSQYVQDAQNSLARYAPDAVVAPGAELGDASIVKESDLAPLPPAVQTYLRRVGVVGRPRTRALEMTFRGFLKGSPDADWMPVNGMQTSLFGETSRRLFYVDGTVKGVPFQAYHRFVDADATMVVRAASVFTMVDARGPEMNQGETVTMLNDMCVFAPSTLLDPSVRFAPATAESERDRTARVSFTRMGITVSAELFFDEAGDLVSFASDDRYLSSDGKTFTKYRWVTPLSDYADFHGLRLARRGEALWKRPEGDLVYARFETIDIRQGALPPRAAVAPPLAVAY